MGWWSLLSLSVASRLKASKAFCTPGPVWQLCDTIRRLPTWEVVVLWRNRALFTLPPVGASSGGGGASVKVGIVSSSSGGWWMGLVVIGGALVVVVVRLVLSLGLVVVLGRSLDVLELLL